VYRQSARSHPPGGRLPLLSARPAVVFPAAESHHPLAGTKLYGSEVTTIWRYTNVYIIIIIIIIGDIDI